ncbi:hypothetical protein PVAP13_3NG067528 [Panicum virgatum]|uniref:Uncharacterized protein n=1 Tax=Panicum virgatum TaxID=38727 RepID=A0A8T0U4I9_PANVG|nr:hypothetical protein PVAP13_3NG067528 [Panicum virgatum]
MEATKFWPKTPKTGGPLFPPNTWAPLLFFLFPLSSDSHAASRGGSRGSRAGRRRHHPASPSPEILARCRYTPRHGRICPSGGRTAGLGHRQRRPEPDQAAAAPGRGAAASRHLRRRAPSSARASWAPTVAAGSVAPTWSRLATEGTGPASRCITRRRSKRTPATASS